MKLLHIIKKLLGTQEHLCYLFLVFFMFPNIALCYTEQMSVVSKICNLILPAAVYYYLFTISRNLGKTFLILSPLLLLGVFQMVLLNIFGQSIIAVDMFLNIVTTNPDEAKELLDNLIPIFLLIAVIYIPLFALSIYLHLRKIYVSEDFRTISHRRSFYALSLGLISLIMAFVIDKRYEMKSDLFPINVFYNIGLAVDRTYMTNHYEETSKDFLHHVVPTHDADRREVYVMVIGETSRAPSWSLYGYERETTPCLAAKSGITCFTKVLSESNTTYKSVPMLISSVHAEEFDSLYYRKSILTAFKEAGFRTAYFSNQQHNRSFIEYFGNEADRCEYIKENPEIYGEHPLDGALLRLVKEELDSNSRKLFILLHTYGSHFNYTERYPAEKRFFTPDMPYDADVKYKDKLVNAYDNTIRYTDEFLSKLIDLLDGQDTDAVMSFCSDHGEDLFDDSREHFLHSSPSPTYYQLHVPFILWMSASYRGRYPMFHEAARQNKDKNISSSLSLFHTMLDLAGLQTVYRKDAFSVVNSRYTETPRVYLNDHNEASPLDDVGMKKQDFKMFHQKGIDYLNPELSNRKRMKLMRVG